MGGVTGPESDHFDTNIGGRMSVMCAISYFLSGCVVSGVANSFSQNPVRFIIKDESAGR